MIQLKELQIPESTLDIRDFSDLGQSFFNYKKYVEFFKNEINQIAKSLINYD